MKSIQDAIYNWLTIKIVNDARPDDTAAKDTVDLFYTLMCEEHDVVKVDVTTDEVMYYVEASLKDDTSKIYRFPRELIEVMLDQINAEPEKYNNYPE